MKKETYERITAPFRTNPKRAQTINVINKAITYAIYVAYPLLLIWLFLTEVNQGLIADFMNNDLFVRALAVPLVSFILLSVLRKAINAKRPYEVFGLDPIISKKTKGKSFPSRHVFSIFVIGMTFLAVLKSPVFGIIILIMGAFLAIIRVVSGVHFPRDVIAGIILGILSGVIGFYLL